MTDVRVGNGKTDKKSDRAKYEELKTAIKKLEETNKSCLILFKSGKDWYKMGGNSVLIYKFSIAPLLKVRVNVQPDTDYTKTVFEDGVVCFRGVEGIKSKLREIGKLKKVQVRNDVYILELNFALTEKQIEEMRGKVCVENEKKMEVLNPDIILLPEIYGRLKYVQRRLFETVRKMTVYERDYNGFIMAKYSRELTKMYMMMNNGMIGEEEGWKEIARLTNLLLIEVTFATELKVLKPDLGSNIGKELVEVRKVAERRAGISRF